MLILIYLAGCAAAGFVASQRGRSPVAWFVGALVLTPLLALIVLALIPSRVPSNLSLESQVRDRLLEDRYAGDIRAHKPAFSASLVYDVSFYGGRRRFKTKAEAIAFCVAHEHDRPQISLSAEQLP